MVRCILFLSFKCEHYWFDHRRSLYNDIVSTIVPCRKVEVGTGSLMKQVKMKCHCCGHAHGRMGLSLVP